VTADAWMLALGLIVFSGWWLVFCGVVLGYMARRSGWWYVFAVGLLVGAAAEAGWAMRGVMTR
jgi:hypothetical protein